MSKLKLKNPNQGPIAKKVLSGINKTLNRKVIDFSELKDSRIHAEELEKTVVSKEALSKHDPLHAIYIYGQNKMSVFAEQLCELPPLIKLNNALADADEEYMPSGPPMSPLTASYFSCWGFFDLCMGQKKETFGTIAIDLCEYLKVDPKLTQVFKCMQNSRMGFYIHRGFSGEYVILEEFITQNQITAIVPSGYRGQSGQIWLARVMPEPFPDMTFGYSVVFTTPYVIAEMQGKRFSPSTEESWRLYFERTLEKTGIKDKILSYEMLMKYGLNRHYWNEYIFEGYVNHQHDMITLAGFPDIPLSRPHSNENEEKWDGKK